jgi:hypothetical protein
MIAAAGAGYLLFIRLTRVKQDVESYHKETAFTINESEAARHRVCESAPAGYTGREAGCRHCGSNEEELKVVGEARLPHDSLFQFFPDDAVPSGHGRTMQEPAVKDKRIRSRTDLPLKEMPGKQPSTRSQKNLLVILITYLESKKN